MQAGVYILKMYSGTFQTSEKRQDVAGGDVKWHSSFRATNC